MPEGSPGHSSLGHQFQGPLRQSDGPHAVVDPPRAQSALSYLEPSSLSQDEVPRRDLHLVKLHLVVAVGRV